MALADIMVRQLVLLWLAGLVLASPVNADLRLNDGTALKATRFSDVPGWRMDDHRAALAAFRISCAGKQTRQLAKACAGASKTKLDRAAARRFFERHFTPFKIGVESGFVTGYYEPTVAGSLQRRHAAQQALLQRPTDLVDINGAKPPHPSLKGLKAARRVGRRLTPYPVRADIETGALGPAARPLVYIDDPVDTFFIHIQGSATVALAEGGTMRVAYAGRNGRPYTAIGRILIDRGIFTKEEMTAEKLKHWLRRHPQDATGIMQQNQSFIFFRNAKGLDDRLGPVGGAGVQLTAGRSLAIDKRFHRYGMPIFLSAALPLGNRGTMTRFDRLMIAQDTGTAIVGPARGDIFLGVGDAAGLAAGRLRHPADFYLLWPKEAVP